MTDEDRSFGAATLDDLLGTTVEVPELLLLGAACCGCCDGPLGRYRAPLPGCCR